MPILKDTLCAKLREYGIKVYPHVNLAGSLYYKAPALIYSKCSLSCCALGAYSYVNANSSLALCTIGNYSSLASHLDLGLPRHLTTNASTSSVFYTEDEFMLQWIGKPLLDRTETARPIINIGHDCWIGAHTVIPAERPLTIGTGAIVAAGSVVTRDIPAYCVAAGNPARIIKARFKDELCADLLTCRWYEYDIPKFMVNHPLNLNDASAFVREFLAHKDSIPKLDNAYTCLTNIRANQVDFARNKRFLQ